MIGRRNFLGLAGAAAAAGLPLPAAAQASSAVARPAAATTPGATLYTIGTKGGPRVGGRRNPSNLLMVDGVPFVIDCGYGVARGLVDAGLPLDQLRYIFITHQHSDHNLEYGNLLYAGWVTNLRETVRSFGPFGTEALGDDYWHMNRIDVETRMADEGRVDPRGLVEATDLVGPGLVGEFGGVRVSAMLTPHPPLRQAFAFRFDTPYGAVVFSGDTSFNPEMAEFARGADMLVHEVVYPAGVDRLVANVATDREAMRQHLLGAHTTPQEAGRIAKQAGVRALVLSHFVPGDMDWITDAHWRDAAAETFDGEIIVASDGQAFPLNGRSN